MKAVQYFTEEYLEQCRGASPEAVLEYLENFRLMLAQESDEDCLKLDLPASLIHRLRIKCGQEGGDASAIVEALIEAWLNADQLSVRKHD